MKPEAEDARTENGRSSLEAGEKPERETALTQASESAVAAPAAPAAPAGMLADSAAAMPEEEAQAARAAAPEEKTQETRSEEMPEAPESSESAGFPERNEAGQKEAPEGCAETDSAQDAAQAADSTQNESEAPSSEEQPLEASDNPQFEASKKKGHGVLWFLFFFFLAAAAAGAYAVWEIRAMLYERPAPMTAEAAEIFVEEGDTSRRAVERLNKAGIDLPLWQARILIRLEPELVKKIHVGRFRFTRGLTPYGILQTLSGPALVDRQLRVPEGAPIWEVKAIFAAAEGLVQDSAKLSDEALARELGLPEGRSLEGFFAPDTYRYGSGTSDLAVLRQAAARQQTLVNAAWEARSEQCAAGSPYELLILASIIEKETGIRSDRHLVSSVFNNRLRIGMLLQTDPTVIYGFGPGWKGTLTRRDLRTPSPWNTYIEKGLPPTPISMPSAASIEAAAHPADTKYLYFVARGDGTSEFSLTLREHNRAVAKYIRGRSVQPQKANQPASVAEKE